MSVCGNISVFISVSVFLLGANSVVWFCLVSHTGSISKLMNIHHVCLIECLCTMRHSLVITELRLFVGVFVYMLLMCHTACLYTQPVIPESV